MSHHKKTSTDSRAMKYWLFGYALIMMLGTAAAAPDPKDLEDIAKGIRQAGFVCEPLFEMRPVGQTERGMQVRFICNNQTLMYRITLAPRWAAGNHTPVERVSCLAYHWTLTTDC